VGQKNGIGGKVRLLLVKFEFETWLFKASDYSEPALYCRFLDPLVFGDYPNIMKQYVGARMPAFTDHESKQVKGSIDFIGVVHYNNVYIKDNSNSQKMVYRDFLIDAALELISKFLFLLLLQIKNCFQSMIVSSSLSKFSSVV
jgi:hypothetical protein